MEIPERLLNRQVDVIYLDGVREMGIITETAEGYEVDILTSTCEFEVEDVLEVGHNFIRVNFNSRFGPNYEYPDPRASN